MGVRLHAAGGTCVAVGGGAALLCAGCSFGGPAPAAAAACGVQCWNDCQVRMWFRPEDFDRWTGACSSFVVTVCRLHRSACRDCCCICCICNKLHLLADCCAEGPAPRPPMQRRALSKAGTHALRSRGQVELYGCDAAACLVGLAVFDRARCRAAGSDLSRFGPGRRWRSEDREGAVCGGMREAAVAASRSLSALLFHVILFCGAVHDDFAHARARATHTHTGRSIAAGWECVWGLGAGQDPGLRRLAARLQVLARRFGEKNPLPHTTQSRLRRACCTVLPSLRIAGTAYHAPIAPAAPSRRERSR